MSFGSVLLLMQNQKKYIHQVARLILQICSDAAIANNRLFQEFAGHFLILVSIRPAVRGMDALWTP